MSQQDAVDQLVDQLVDQPNYPQWFKSCLDTPSENHQVEVHGSQINYVTWGEIGKPGIVLLHGSNANLEWWRPIAPMLSDQFRIAAMDMSGAGNSGWRESYSGKMYAAEIMAVAAAAKLGDKPFVVGHSFGGHITLETGHLHGENLGGLIMMDSTLQPPELRDEFEKFREERRQQPLKPTRIYEEYKAALARFRLMPEQHCDNQFLVEYLAHQSLRQVDGGWTWKFDPAMFRNLTMAEAGSPDQTSKLLAMKCPAAFILAETSTDYSERAVAYTREVAEHKLPIFTIPATFHHLMFDQPLAVAMAIKATLLAWSNAN